MANLSFTLISFASWFVLVAPLRLIVIITKAKLEQMLNANERTFYSLYGLCSTFKANAIAVIRVSYIDVFAFKSENFVPLALRAANFAQFAFDSYQFKAGNFSDIFFLCPSLEPRSTRCRKSRGRRNFWERMPKWQSIRILLM